jgi:hypothetical protein
VHQGGIDTNRICDTANGSSGIAIFSKQLFSRIKYLHLQVLLSGVTGAAPLALWCACILIHVDILIKQLINNKPGIQADGVLQSEQALHRGGWRYFEHLDLHLSPHIDFCVQCHGFFWTWRNGVLAGIEIKALVEFFSIWLDECYGFGDIHLLAADIGDYRVA